MCMGFQGPPFGIPIPEEVHEMYSPELKTAWLTFDDWWKKASESGLPVKRESMPQAVKTAMDLICITPIPSYEEEGFTGNDSCYMVGVRLMMSDQRV